MFPQQIFRSGNTSVSIDWNIPAFLLLLIVLALELKDKLLARDELAVGRAVQFALLPDQNPEIRGWDVWLFTQPANEVGGDLVDYLQIDEKHWGLSLGDVAGKGLGAALLMAKLQATLRALAPNFSSLSELGKQTNTIFYRDGLPDRFISLVYLEIRNDSNKIHLLNAGHLPPLIIHNNSIQEMQQGAPALGIRPDSKYMEQNLTLKKNDILIVYSDGLTEARNEEGEFYGDTRLLELLKSTPKASAEKIGASMLAHVKNFIGNARANDDLSLIVVKRTSGIE
jgi:sigma-B regulation protein RsbU (phosphoserine phosphatase)